MPTAIESMTGVSVRCNWLFANMQTLELFPTHVNTSKTNRVAVLYGKNGSGKTTMAQGFREYAISAQPRTVELSPLVNRSHIPVSPGGRSEKIFVFDEKYIEQKVRVKEEGLDAIVLFGEQVAIEQQIEAVKILINDLTQQQRQQETECAKYTNSAVITSPQYWLTQITQSLRTIGGWADTKGIKLNGNRTAATVNETEIDKLGQLTPSLGELETKAEFDRQFALFTSANAQAQQNTRAIRQYSIVGNLECTTSDMLSKVISKPHTSEREKALLELFGIRVISDAKVFLSDTANNVCPTCLQEVGDEYRAEMLSRIETILNREVVEFRANLSKLKQQVIEKDDYSSYSGLEVAAYCNVQQCIDAFNNAVEKHNNAVQAKIDNPFEAMTYDISVGLTTACNALNQALTILEAARIAFNDAITGRTRLKNALLKLNDEIAHYAIKVAYVNLVAQRTAKKTSDENLAALIADISGHERRKRELDAQRKNFQIAVDDINDSLAYIFFSRGRIELALGTDQMYHLKSNGKEVDPKKVSCGERNALALCYFFTEIAKDTDVRAIYADEVCLIIDDPVSSFDTENRIGILSFLRWKLGQVLLGCPTTKVLMMTHDISVLYDTEKVLEEIAKECTAANKSAEFNSFELNGTGIISFHDSRRNKHKEYTRLLETVYDYARNGTADVELFIGNSMRRVLEAFSTFLYTRGIADISRDADIMQNISEDKRTYFQNLMYRLVLHGESHYEEHIQGFQSMEFFSHLSLAEKQRTARDILCFMYLLNKLHILAHLTPNAEANIAGWIASISSAPSAHPAAEETTVA